MESPSDRSSSFIDFYDPYLYDARIGPGSRIGWPYADLAVEGGGPVLELGCGTGDILFEISRRGIKTYGLDGSERMLQRAGERLKNEPEHSHAQVVLTHGRMEDFHFDVTFSQIFLTNDVVSHLLDGESLRSTLKQCYRHLRPGGRLVLDIEAFDVRYLARYSDSAQTCFRFRGSFPMNDGERLQVWERTFFDSESEILTAHFRYERLSDCGEVLGVRDRTLYQRPRRVEEMVLALEACGFGSVRTSQATTADSQPTTMIQAARLV